MATSRKKKRTKARKAIATKRTAAKRKTKAESTKTEGHAKKMSSKDKLHEETVENGLHVSDGDGKAPSKVKFESVLAKEEAVSYFEALIEGLKKGTIQLKQGSHTIVLKPNGQVSIEVKASRKGDKEKLAFEITWRGEAAAESDLKITAS